MWGCSPSMLHVFDLLEEAAKSDSTLLIEGETGTGKELAAEAVHFASPRAKGPYIVVDCAAIPKELIESELFGHVRGAFTGAESDRDGAFESAEGGTVFIDEIGELPLDLQPRLLGALERRTVKPVGSDVMKKIDVRIVAATNRDLEREVREGRFREDLLFRLNILKVTLPPLRTRPEDIVLLTERFLADAPTLSGVPLELKPEAKARLVAWRWPGNARELRNIIDRGASLSEGRFFRVPDDLEDSLEVRLAEDAARVSDIDADGAPAPARAPALGSSGAAGTLTEPLWRGKSYKDAREAVLEDFERGYILAILAEHRGNVSAAARAAGIHRNILHRMMARYGISR